ncbi:MAG: type I 3-dehydroquinate dehydratase [Bryobacteraceae bacterium]
MMLRTALPKVCIALGFPSVEKLLAQARRELQEGESFLEFRLDYLPDPKQGIEAIRDFVKEFPEATLLVTCRRHQNHGHFNGSIEEQIHLLEQAVDAGARAIDLEIESAENAVVKLEGLRARTCFIVSYHNWESTPAVEAVLRRLMKVDADAYKLVTTARKPSDIQRVLSAGKMPGRAKLILLAMGECGFPSRILATFLRKPLHLCRSPNGRRHGIRASLCQSFARALSRREVQPASQGFRCDCRPRAPFDLACGTQPRLSG